MPHGVGLGRWVVLGGVLLTVFLLVVSVIDLASDYLEAERNAAQNTGNLARVLAAQTEAAIATVDQALRHVVDVMQGQPVLATPDNPTFHQQLRSMTDQVPFLREVDIFDAKGDVVQMSQVYPDRPFNVADREYFQFHRDHREDRLYVGPPIHGKLSGRLLLTLTRRLNGPDGSFAGVALGVLDPAYVQTLYDSIRVGDHGTVSLLLYDGRLLARSPFDERQLGQSVAKAPMWLAMVAGGQRSGTVKGRYVSDGRVRIAGYEIIEPGPLVVWVAIDEVEALADWYRGAILYGVAIIAFVGLMALLVGMLRVQLRRRESSELARRESGRLAYATIDALSAHLCVLDDSGTVLVANRAWRRMAGNSLAPGAAVGVGSNYLAACDQGGNGAAAVFAAGIRAVMAGQRSEHVQEYPLEGPEGQEWYLGRVTRFIGSGPVRVVVLHQDITQRRQAAAELLREKERAETYLTITESLIVELDPDARIRRINPRACQLLGYQEQDLLGRDWFELAIPISVREMVRAAFRRIVQGDMANVEYFENELETRRGDIRIISWHNNLILDPKGEIAGTLSSGQDVTERRLVEDSLRQSERRLAKAQGIARLGNWEEDLNSGAVWWSDEVFRIFARGPEAFEDGFDAYLRFVHPDDRGEVRDQERQLIGEGMPISLDHRIVLPDGTIRIVNLQAEPMVEESCGSTRSHGIVHDITDRKQSEMALRRALLEAATANRTRSEFLSNMSHELNTPLNAVIGFSEMLADELLGPLGQSKYREFSRVIHRSGRHLQQIISDILDIAKLEGADVPVDEEVLDLGELIGEYLPQVEAAASTAGLTLVGPDGTQRLGLNADRRMVKQCLRNLLSNAIKFTPAHGRVTVSMQQARDGRVGLTVSDTGIGMAPEDIPRALDPFSQIDGTLTRPYEGTGLGLSLTKVLVEKHDGTLEIESQPGRGTHVHLWFPAERTVLLEGEPQTTQPTFA